LGGWSIRCAAVCTFLLLGASAFADSDRTALPSLSQQQTRKTRKACFTMTTVSRIPLDCKQLAAIPTTSSPMSIFGHVPQPEKQ
jgi:hypothetical protein